MISIKSNNLFGIYNFAKENTNYKNGNSNNIFRSNSNSNKSKNVDAYFKCKVTSIKEAVKQSDPVKKKSEANVIKADVCKLIIRNPG